MTIKSIFQLAVLSLLLNSSVFAVDNSTVVGKWDIELNFQGRGVTINLTKTENGDELGGTWAGPRGSTPLSDVSFVGDTLTFSRETQRGVTQISLKLEGNTLTGSLTTPRGDLPIVAKKST